MAVTPTSIKLSRTTQTHTNAKRANTHTHKYILYINQSQMKCTKSGDVQSSLRLNKIVD